MNAQDVISITKKYYGHGKELIPGMLSLWFPHKQAANAVYELLNTKNNLEIARNGFNLMVKL